VNISPSADNAASPTLNHVLTKSLTASYRPRPYLTVTYIPRCPCCHSPNPKADMICQVCQAEQPPPTMTYTDDVVLPQPLLARLLFWIADKLRNLADGF
jgi:hypothetical protein